MSGRNTAAWTHYSVALDGNPFYRNDALAAAAWAEITQAAPHPWMLLDDPRILVGHRRAMVAVLDLVSRYMPAWAFPHPPVARLFEWADRVMRGESEVVIDWQFAIAESLHKRLAEHDQDFGDRLYRFHQKVLVMAPDLIRGRVMLLLVRGHPDGMYRILNDIGMLREALSDPQTASSVLYLAGQHPGLAEEFRDGLLQLFSTPGSVNLDPHLQFFTTAFPVEEITRRAIAWDAVRHPASRAWLLALMSDPRYASLRDANLEQLPAWYRDHPGIRSRFWRLAAQYPELDLVSGISLRGALEDPAFLAYLVRVRVPEALPFLIDQFRRQYAMIVRGDGGLDIVQALGQFDEWEIRAQGRLTDTEWVTYRDIRDSLKQVG